MRVKAFVLTAVAAFALSVPASAHHSFAMFDAEKTVTMQGQVKEFEWTNPHSWLRLMVMDQKTGKPMLWVFELSSPARLATLGMHSDSMKPGEVVTVTYHPMKDGTRGGQFMDAKLPDGKQLVSAYAPGKNDQ
jgi:hypothetical protein